jgi:hypothetical protein
LGKLLEAKTNSSAASRSSNTSLKIGNIMILHDMSKFGQLRIWKNPNKELNFKNNSSKSYILDVKEKKLKQTENATIILEYYFGVGGRLVYGCLGADFIGKNDSKLCATTYTQVTNEILLSDSILKPYENVYLGLSKEFEESVYLGLKEFNNENDFILSGFLDFCYAAHSPISSNGWVYEILTYAILNLLINPKAAESLENITEILDNAKKCIIKAKKI